MKAWSFDFWRDVLKKLKFFSIKQILTLMSAMYVNHNNPYSIETDFFTFPILTYSEARYKLLFFGIGLTVFRFSGHTFIAYFGCKKFLRKR